MVRAWVRPVIFAFLTLVAVAAIVRWPQLQMIPPFTDETQGIPFDLGCLPRHDASAGQR